MTSPPNIVWVVLDSLRVDHTSMDGYDRDTTPNLQRIADAPAGAWFPHCIAHGNSTRISTASIVTGTNPSHHGVRGDRVIPDELDTVPDRLRDCGYRTGALSRNANSAMGFDRGFDEFEWIASSTILRSVPARTLLKYAMNIRRHSAGLTTNTAKHATPFLINEMAKQWLDRFQRDGAPYFLYLHYNEPHRPYYPPLPYMDRYTADLDMSTEEAAAFSMYVHENMSEVIANGCQFSDDQWAALTAMYDAEIAYTDECIGQLFEHVQSLDGESIFVVTADHGELFGEKGLLSHKILLHDALVNVPLVVHGFDEINHQTDELIQHADLMETFVRQAGGDASGMQGIDLRTDTRDFAISQEGESGPTIDQFLEFNPNFDRSRYHEPFLTAIRTKDFKFQKSDAGTDFYRLPDEDTDVSEDYPERAADMEAALDQWLQEEGQLVGEKQGEFTPAMQEQLEDLGYLT